jgi:hypothetical protein
LQSNCKSGARAGCSCHKRGSKDNMAVDTLDYLPAVHVMPADEQDTRCALCKDMPQATDYSAQLACAGRSYTSETPSQASSGQRHRLADREVSRAKRGLRAAASALGDGGWQREALLGW